MSSLTTISNHESSPAVGMGNAKNASRACSSNNSSSFVKTSSCSKNSNSSSSNKVEAVSVAVRVKPLSPSHPAAATTKATGGGGEKEESGAWTVSTNHDSSKNNKNIIQLSETAAAGHRNNSSNSKFVFDHVFDDQRTNEEIYETMALPLVETTVLESLNSCLFCYGQTSSGKTYTMQGPATIGRGQSHIEGQSSYDDGIIQRAAKDIFRLISEQQQEEENDDDDEEEEEGTRSKQQYLVRCSFVELYNEQVRDLLSSPSSASPSLTIRDVDGQVEIVGCCEEVVTSPRELLETLSQGENNRTVAATGMNERSSRSHTIVRITVECHDILVSTSKSYSNQEGQQRHDESEETITKDNNSNKENIIADSESSAAAVRSGVRVATLNLVDLAGSESVKQTGATGDRRKEGGLINQSLLALSRVISARAAASSNSSASSSSSSSAPANGGGTNKATTSKFVNYRDSKLTRILRPALSGDAKMAVICCASQSNRYVDETKSTLQFAARAKRVTTNAKVHEVISDEQSMIRRLQKELDDVKKQLLEHQRGQQQQQQNDGNSSNQEDKKESLFDLMREKEERFNKLVLQATSSWQLSSTSRQNKKKKDRRMTFGHGLCIPVSDTSSSFTSPLPSKPKKTAAAPNTTGRRFLRLNEDDLAGICPGDESCSGTSKICALNDAVLAPQQELKLVQESLVVQRTQRQQEEDSFREVIKEQNTALHEKDEIISKLQAQIACLQEENSRLLSLLQSRNDNSIDRRGSNGSFQEDNVPSENAFGHPSSPLVEVKKESKIEYQDEGVMIDCDNEGETRNIVLQPPLESSATNRVNQTELVSAWGRFITVECDDSRLKSAWAIFVRHFALYVVWSYVFDMPKNWWPENNNESPANRIRYTYADRSDAEKQRFDDAALNTFKISQQVWDRVKKDGDIKKFTAGMKRRSKNGRLPRFQIVAEHEFGLVEFLDHLWPDRTLIRDTEDDEEDAQD